MKLGRPLNLRAAHENTLIMRSSAATLSCVRSNLDNRGMRSELRAELLRRAEQDQVARTGLLRRAGQEEGAPAERGPDRNTAASVDVDNLIWLRNVVAEVGWPGRSMVGEDGAHAAWLLAQHADRDPALQRRCLDLITEAAKSGEASLAELAYLTDRVLLAEGQPQEYGTQMKGREEGWVARRLREPETVDERRAAMSLRPLSEYIARMAHDYGPPRPATLTCAECSGSIEVWLPDEGETRHVRCAACGWTTSLTVGVRAEPPARRGPLTAGTGALTDNPSRSQAMRKRERHKFPSCSPRSRPSRCRAGHLWDATQAAVEPVNFTAGHAPETD